MIGIVCAFFHTEGKGFYSSFFGCESNMNVYSDTFYVYSILLFYQIIWSAEIPSILEADCSESTVPGTWPDEQIQQHR